MAFGIDPRQESEPFRSDFLAYLPRGTPWTTIHERLVTIGIHACEDRKTEVICTWKVAQSIGGYFQDQFQVRYELDGNRFLKDVRIRRMRSWFWEATHTS